MPFPVNLTSKIPNIESITCPICNKTSYHPEDIKNKYCGFCHEWHENMGITRVEVINHSKYIKEQGRILVHWDRRTKVEYQLQDDGKTLKVFISDR